MTEVGVRFSISDEPLQVLSTKTVISRRKKNSITKKQNNLFNQSQRSQPKHYCAVLPIISLSSFSDFKQKFVPMSSNNKSAKQTAIQSPIPTEFRFKLPFRDMSQAKLRPISSNRSIPANMPKSSLSYPTIIPRTPSTVVAHRPIYPSADRLYYVVNSSLSPRRTTSARINPFAALPLHQQPNLLPSSVHPRPHPQYGHFLAYLRRQSLARMRRKQQEQEEAAATTTADIIEATITLQSSRPSPLPSFLSTSNLSLGSVTPETSSMPTISLQTKRVIRPATSYRQIQRSPTSIPTNYRLSLNQTPPLKPLVVSPRASPKQEFLPPPPPVALSTPTNSIVDETINPSTKKSPYELQLSGDMLNYCYVSESGATYQGQLLSTSV